MKNEPLAPVAVTGGALSVIKDIYQSSTISQALDLIYLQRDS